MTREFINYDCSGPRNNMVNTLHIGYYSYEIAAEWRCPRVWLKILETNFCWQENLSPYAMLSMFNSLLSISV